MSWVTLTLSKEQKISEFRQAWIDGLRQDLAIFFAGARAFARAIEAFHEHKGKVALPINDQKISDIRYQTAETRYRVRFCLNPDEAEHQELLRRMDRAISEQNDTILGNSDSIKTFAAIEHAADYVSPVLKKEWKRVKKGELPFRIARWMAIIIVVVSIAFVGFLLSRTP